ncbi:hypothetical protein PM082_014241 [Marasmius tenuissimus]|nr:hypothetical protein PM082_014241 [Marasmius tenuissimus]
MVTVRRHTAFNYRARLFEPEGAGLLTFIQAPERSIAIELLKLVATVQCALLQTQHTLECCQFQGESSN